MTFDAILNRLAGGTRTTHPHSPPAAVPAWKPDPPRDPALGPKPRIPYGYVVEGEPHYTTLETLAEHLAEHPATAEVWTPATDGFVRPEEAHDLLPALREVRRRRLRTSALWSGLFMLAMAAATVLLWWSREVGLGSLFYVVGVFAALSLGESLLALRRPLDASTFVLARQNARHTAWVTRQPVPFTRWLLGCIVVVAAIALWNDDRALAVAGLVKDRAWDEPWRLLTAPLLHVSFFHVLMNAGALLWLGTLMEAHAPRARLPLVFLVSALGGALLSAAVDPRDALGASGGLLGLVGYLLVLAHRRAPELPDDFRRRLGSVLAGTAALGVLGIAFIDNAAHLGGFAAGLLLGRALIGEDDGPRAGWLRAAEWASLAVVAAAAAGTLLLIFLDPLGTAAALERR